VTADFLIAGSRWAAAMNEILMIQCRAVTVAATLALSSEVLHA
jgi:hypothetical protein